MFTNNAVEKERKKIKIYMLIAILSFAIACIFLYYGNNKVKEASKKKDTLHNIIISNEKDLTDKKSYINNSVVPFKFAIYDNTTDAYYFVSDGTYIYVAYMKEEDYNKLNNEDIKNKSQIIEGITKKTPEDIKKLAIEAYNEGREEENKLALSDYDAYFGSVHLDMTLQDSSVGNFEYGLFSIFLFMGITLLITFLIINFRFKKGIKKLTADQIMKIDAEMNDKEAFHYEKAHIFLTKNYIINFAGSFNVIDYKDIIWVYPFIRRYNGIKTSQSIIVVTKDGKRKNVADIDAFTKGKKEIYDEIFNTIASKNPNMIIGYNKESQERAKELLKSLKNR